MYNYTFYVIKRQQSSERSTFLAMKEFFLLLDDLDRNKLRIHGEARTEE